MKISFSPILSDRRLTVHKAGESLTINNVLLDFSAVPEGATLPSGAIECEFILGPVERIGGQIHLTLLLPHADGASESALFPDPIIDPADGPLELPQ